MTAAEPQPICLAGFLQAGGHRLDLGWIHTTNRLERPSFWGSAKNGWPDQLYALIAVYLQMADRLHAIAMRLCSVDYLPQCGGDVISQTRLTLLEANLRLPIRSEPAVRLPLEANRG